MPPSQFPDDMVSVVEEVADLDRVVAALLVISRGFLLVVVRPENLLLFLFLLFVSSVRSAKENESARARRGWKRL